ncbi:MAG: NAD(P)/FAD-dependent oxidoreductase [Tissierellia bacterium]|nr:NAD(P)/FAD-dependent oxidoreductase [Tissierellia bacterium]
MKNKLYDVIIIGGGCVGTAVARTLSRFQLNILLLEKGTEICQGTTKANSAIIHGGYDNYPGSLKAKLNVQGSKMFPKLAEELGFTYNRCGSLVLALEEDQIPILRELYQRGIQNGVEGLEILSAQETREREPAVNQRVYGSLSCFTAAVIDPFNYTYALMENALENGAELQVNREVTDLQKTDRGIQVCCGEDRYESHYVVNAAGLYSGRIAEQAGDKGFDLIPTKGVYRLLDTDAKPEIHHVLFQTPTDAGKGVLVTPTYHGNIMIGPTATRAEGPEDTTVDLDSLEWIDQMAKKSVPELSLDKTIREFTGLRAKPVSGDFLIRPSTALPGLIHAAGIESPGLAASPAIADYVLQLLGDAGLELHPDPQFNPIRKAPIVLKELERDRQNQIIRGNPAYGRIVCRCETVSEGEILAAIHRPCGATTVDGIKRRVRPGMGRCQGGFCGPKVIEILARELHIPAEEVLKEHRGSSVIKGKIK